MPTGIKNLIIVESPTKGRTIEKLLGSGFRVAASYGHVRDLPKAELGVDEQTFEPKYVLPPKSRKVIKALKDLVKEADAVFIATDLDREGEAIGWHVVQVLGLNGKKGMPKVQRIIFHEITKNAIDEALQHPRPLNQKLVDAQQARRILDRLVGYKLSPLLWKKVARGLSAGRVQSVAVRLVVDREREIERFKPQEYWSIEAELEENGQRFLAILVGKDDRKFDKLAITKEADAQKILDDLAGATFGVINTSERTVSKGPFPPFTTSTLQQEAARKLGWSARETMQVAQNLYEEGYITYHRTDSVSLSPQAIGIGRNVIKRLFGEKYLPKTGRQFKAKSRYTQEAHEAIRPAYPDRSPEAVDLADRERKLYELIWRRFLASQMIDAKFSERSVDMAAKDYRFRATGSVLIVDGFLKIWPIEREEKRLPDLSLGDAPNLIELFKKQHFTEPPPRFNMASLVKTLEEYGIGRPSTYAPIISTIIDRNYVVTSGGVFRPTDLGILVTDLLVEHFPEIVDVSFTARMEEDLDAIAEKERPWREVLADFYRPFAAHLAQKQEEIQKSDYEEVLDEKCPETGHPLVVKMGRFGKFIACSGFPECKYTRAYVVELNQTCPECKKGKVVERKTRKGRTFWACSRYPDCRWATWQRPSISSAKASQ